MKKVFDEMTRLSSDNPKTALGIIAVLILALKFYELGQYMTWFLMQF